MIFFYDFKVTVGNKRRINIRTVICRFIEIEDDGGTKKGSSGSPDPGLT